MNNIDRDILFVRKAASLSFGGWIKHGSGEIRAKKHPGGFYIPQWRCNGSSCSIGGQTQLITKGAALLFAAQELDKHFPRAYETKGGGK